MLMLNNQICQKHLATRHWHNAFGDYIVSILAINIMRLAIRQMRFVREMPVALARMFSPGSTSMRARASMCFLACEHTF